MSLTVSQLAQTDTWWWATLTSGQGLTLLGLMLGMLLLTIWLGWRLQQATQLARQEAGDQARPRPTLRDRFNDESGTATIEFVMVFPFLLMTALLLIQTTLVFTGLFYVNYASFAATRSAIVYIPMDLDDTPNTLSAFEGGQKYDRIRSAAIVALIPVSGEESGEFDAATRIVQGVTRAYQDMGQAPPNWIENKLANRVNYAANHTQIEIYEVVPSTRGDWTLQSVSGYGEFGPKDLICVEVRHEFALSIPVASQIFAAASDSGSYTAASPDTDSPGPPGQWTAITARYMLSNEGIDRRLPEAPPGPRLD